MKKPIIQFNQFTFKYRSQVEPTLKNINLSVYEGEKILIVGPSGSGKSTLAHCINGLVPFSYKGELEGSLRIKEQETKELDIFTVSKVVGTVLQDPDGQFIGLSVGEDIAFALENDGVLQPDMTKQVMDVSRLVDMESKLDASLHELSGGQKQKVSLAGVMVDHVDILLFDEPLANLDPATGKHAISLIDQIKKETNTTVLIIEHRLEDVLHGTVDRVIVMDEGQIVSDSTPDDLLASPVLESAHIREPLYIKAMKYAGCKVTPAMQPAHLNTLQIDSWRKHLVQWFEAVKQPEDDTKKDAVVLELDQISFRYEKGKNTIDQLSFLVSKGEMISIVGKNGAGKSTLSKLICGFEKVHCGTIRLHGKDITGDSIRQRAERIGMVMQNPNHMISKHMIYDEVALGLVKRGFKQEEIKSRVDTTLRICGLYPYRNWPISALSFGQKKRVTIASVLALNPDILILDEPTAGQDLRHYTEIMDFLLELNRQGVTILLITHDMHLMLEYTPRAIVIADGKIIADKSAVEVLTDQTVIQSANLKETSLFGLAKRIGIEQPAQFVTRFITHDREVRKTWQ